MSDITTLKYGPGHKGKKRDSAASLLADRPSKFPKLTDERSEASQDITETEDKEMLRKKVAVLKAEWEAEERALDLKDLADLKAKLEDKQKAVECKRLLAETEMKSATAQANILQRIGDMLDNKVTHGVMLTEQSVEKLIEAQNTINNAFEATQGIFRDDVVSDSTHSEGVQDTKEVAHVAMTSKKNEQRLRLQLKPSRSGFGFIA